MQTLEITAKSVQEATQTAAQKLNVAPDRLKVTVLEESKGLFGKSTVRIRAEVMEAPAAPAPVVTPPPAAAEPERAAKPARGRGRGKAASAPEPGPTPVETIEEVQAAVDAPAPEEVQAPAAKENDRRGRGRRGSKPTEAAPVAAEASEAPAESEAELVATEADAENVVAIVSELLDAAQIQVTATIGGINGKYVNVVLDGKDVAFIVGKHGEVLNALQYLTNIVIGRRLERQVRATLDGNDYRRRREEALTQLATKIAEQVKQRGEEAVLDALPAFERRIVHKALSEIDGIQTYSEGEEPNRRVVIAPLD